MAPPAARVLAPEDGAAAVEYAVVLAPIMVVYLNVVTALGHTVSGTFSEVNSTPCG